MFPILYGGAVFIDGAPAPEGTVVTARVGDWQNQTTVQGNSRYYGLLVAPPTSAYYRTIITFHVEGMTAAEQDLFLPAGGPTFKDSGYDLHFVRPQQQTPTPRPTATPATAPTATAASVTATATSLAPVATATPTVPARISPGGIGGGPVALAGVGAAVLLAAGGFAIWRSRRAHS